MQSALAQLQRRFTLERPPGPKGDPILGVLPLFRKDPLRALSFARQEYGTAVATRIGPLWIYIWSDPETIADVLLHKQSAFLKDPVTHGLSLMLGQGLLTSEGDLWKKQRRLIAPALKRAHIQAYADSMVACTLRFAERLPRDSQRDVHTDMMALTLDIVVETLFGASIDDASGRQVGHAVETVMGAFVEDVRTWRRFLPPRVPTPARRRALDATHTIDRVLYAIIQQARTRPPGGLNLLSRLLEATDSDGARMSDAQVRDEAVTMFVAGHETTALTLSYTLLALAEHPHIARQLQDELDGVLRGAPPTLDDLPRLPFTHAVIQESLRAFPPAWTVGRLAQEDVEIGGWLVPKGDQCMASPWVMHHDPRFFDDPWTFNPHRWLDGLEQKLPRFAFFPFGGGARVCIGNHFAMMEATLALATLAQRFDVHPTPGFQLRFNPAVTLRPARGVDVRLTRRTPPGA